MANLSARSIRKLRDQVRRIDATPGGTGAGTLSALPAAGYPGTCVFGFITTGSVSARSGTTPGTGPANIEIINAAGTLVADRAITLSNRYAGTIGSGIRGTCYLDGSRLVVQGWEC